MKKFLAIEFFWLILALVVAFPSGSLILNLMGDTSTPALTTEEENYALIILYIISVVIAFIGVYIIRFVNLGWSFLLGKEEEKEAKKK